MNKHILNFAKLERKYLVGRLSNQIFMATLQNAEA